jgi:hypothetical protein
VDECAFCIFHDGELKVVPAGIAKGYPSEIDFDGLPGRIKRFEDPLLQIIMGECQSEYKVAADKNYAQHGRRAATIGALYGRFELLQVNYSVHVI